MYKALYRKWRPQDFDTVCGQNHVTEVLKYQVANQKFSHAYLFCGSRGTGKTSCAKIMAKAVNCENPQNGNPCNKCAACQSIDNGTATDVIEMDAASNNGVADVRDIRDEVVFSPAELKFRVYIIDEVHMLSASAFNALLKTLEEPPSHVIFILATTEMQKLPTTIVSRCQQYQFRRIATSVLVERMQTIAKEEKIPLEQDGAFLIARMAAGGMRDAISLLELCAGTGERINEETAAVVLGVGNRNVTFSLVKSIAAKDYASIFDAVDRVMLHSGDLAVFWQELIDTYRDMMVCKTCHSAKEYLDLTENEYLTLKELSAKFSIETLIYHATLLEEVLPGIQKATLTKRSTAELTLVRLCEPRLSLDTGALLTRIAKLEEEVARLRYGIPQDTPETKEASKTVEEPKAPPADACGEDKAVSLKKEEKSASNEAYVALGYWPRLLETFAERKPALAGFLSKTKGYYSEKNGFLVKTASDFAVGIIQRDDVLLTLKSLISEFEECNILSANFSVLSDAKAGDLPLIDELEQLIGEQE